MRIIYNVIGTIFLVLGFMGLFLPVLPTTPFWLLTAYCYLRGSKRLYHWAMSIPVFREIIENYREHHAIPRRTKIFTIATLWVTIIVSCYLVARWWVVLLLLAVAIGVTWHILSLKTIPEEGKHQ